MDAFWNRVLPEPRARKGAVATWCDRLNESVAKGLPFQPTKLALTCQDGDVRTVIAETVSIGGEAGGEDSRLIVFYDLLQHRRGALPRPGGRRPQTADVRRRSRVQGQARRPQRRGGLRLIAVVPGRRHRRQR